MTQVIVLTDTPQAIGTQVYAQSEGGDFNYSFGSQANVDAGYSHSEVNYDGTYGQMWVWKSIPGKVILKYDAL